MSGVVLDTIQKRLPVTLTDEEKLAAGHDLGATVQEIQNEEAAQKQQREQMKAKLSMLESRRSLLASW